MYEQILSLVTSFFKSMEDKGIKFEAAPRKNMNRLMSRFECYHIKHRSIIESDWGTLKNNFQLEYHKARCMAGMFRHFFLQYCCLHAKPKFELL